MLKYKVMLINEKRLIFFHIKKCDTLVDKSTNLTTRVNL